MAMNKTEKKQVEDLKRIAALRWSDPVEPDVGIPGCGETRGFVPSTWGNSPTVAHALSNSVFHATDVDQMPAKTTSQRPIMMHSTRLLALQQLRYLVADDCARRLKRVDDMIEAQGDAGR